MKTYKVLFSPTGVLTRIPDAQTLFGAFCQSIRIQGGKEKLNEYLNSFQGIPWFIHSNLLPEGFFPAPKQPILTLESIQNTVRKKDRASKLDILAQLKKYKKFEYVSESVFSDYILSDHISDIKNKLVMNGGTIDTDNSRGISVLESVDQKKSDSFLMKSVLQTRSGTLSNKIEKDLFYQKQLFFEEGSRFMLFIKSSIDLPELTRILKNIEITGTGPSISVGLNQLHFESIEEIESDHSGNTKRRVCLLSACLPENGEFDLSKSDYGIESSLYRTSFSYVKDGFSGRFNLLQAGSMMHPEKNQDYYGTVALAETKGKPVYHYGIGFVL